MASTLDAGCFVGTSPPEFELLRFKDKSGPQRLINRKAKSDFPPSTFLIRLSLGFLFMVCLILMLFRLESILLIYFSFTVGTRQSIGNSFLVPRSPVDQLPIVFS